MPLLSWIKQLFILYILLKICILYFLFNGLFIICFTSFTKLFHKWSPQSKHTYFLKLFCCNATLNLISLASVKTNSFIWKLFLALNINCSVWKFVFVSNEIFLHCTYCLYINACVSPHPYTSIPTFLQHVKCGFQNNLWSNITART